MILTFFFSSLVIHELVFSLLFFCPLQICVLLFACLYIVCYFILTHFKKNAEFVTGGFGSQSLPGMLGRDIDDVKSTLMTAACWFFSPLS